ncbi:hypothetical protein, partial [Endozoicomonas sp. SESOKO1]|uniref:hypothetical protein n=1 Tax=Endozoicomonas sp. SESOKO1 TaxID=2828742 RepID=UPI002147694E
LMHSPISYVQLRADPGRLSSVQDPTFSESAASGLAFSRGVAEVAEVAEEDSFLCPMRTDEMTENHFQQPAVPFHNPFHDSRFKKRSVAIVVSHATKDHQLHLPARTDAQNDTPAPEYIPDNEHFSIQSILGLDQSSLPGSSAHSFHDNEKQAQTSAEAEYEMESSDNMAGMAGMAGSSGKKPDESCSLPIERQSNRYQNDPAYVKRLRPRQGKRCQNDPAFAQRQRERYKNDRAFAERKKARQRERYQNDPAFAQRLRERERERKKELRKDPACGERLRMYHREYYKNNPAYAERHKARQRERYQNDPTFAQRQRERYQNDPAFAERKKARQRERYQNDPAFAQRLRERARERKKELRKVPPALNTEGNTKESAALESLAKAPLKQGE